MSPSALESFEMTIAHRARQLVRRLEAQKGMPAAKCEWPNSATRVFIGAAFH